MTARRSYMRHGLTAPIADADRHRRASGPWRWWLHLPQWRPGPRLFARSEGAPVRGNVSLW